MSERVALAEAIAERLDGRKGSNQHVKKEGQEIFPDAHGQQTRDIAAAKAGLGSGKTLEAAQRVVERGTPELVEAMDHPTDEPAAERAFLWASKAKQPADYSGAACLLCAYFELCSYCFASVSA